MNNLFKAVPLIFLMVAFDALAQVCIRKSRTDGMQWLLASMVLYSSICVLIYLVYNFLPFSLTNSIWNVFSTITVAVIGIFFFREKINTLDKLALCFMIIGLLLVGISNNK